jgi:hypothetical protein
MWPKAKSASAAVMTAVAGKPEAELHLPQPPHLTQM